MITKELQHSIDQSVLCWLATVDADHWPNVSPKEMFLSEQHDQLVIAHIASPQSIKNIQQNDQVGVSWVDIFVQKGHKIKGRAALVTPSMARYTYYLI